MAQVLRLYVVGDRFKIETKPKALEVPAVKETEVAEPFRLETAKAVQPTASRSDG